VRGHRHLPLWRLRRGRPALHGRSQLVRRRRRRPLLAGGLGGEDGLPAGGAEVPGQHGLCEDGGPVGRLLPRGVAEAEALCDPADFPGGCGPAGGELVCGQGGVGCFGAQECRCAIFELPCLMPELVCREFHDPGSTRSVFECQPPDSCAEGDRCDGDRAIRCDSWGRPQVFDCAAQGMVCAESSGFVGCADGTDTCSAISGPTCGAGETVLGCCDASGSFETGSAPVPCVPDREVSRYDCPHPSRTPTVASPVGVSDPAPLPCASTARTAPDLPPDAPVACAPSIRREVSA
jgi:hypothetical protein